jgi:hypothetical protein
MTRKAAARTQHQAGAARRDETEDGTGRKARPVRKTKASGAGTTVTDLGPASEAPVAGGTLPPPHPALVELVRLLARADARRARTEEKETR